MCETNNLPSHIIKLIKPFHLHLWNALNPLVLIPINEIFQYWGRNYHVPTATDPFMGMAMYAMKTIKGSIRQLVELISYIGPTYKWKVWIKLLEHILEMKTYSLETNVVSCHSKQLVV